MMTPHLARSCGGALEAGGCGRCRCGASFGRCRNRKPISDAPRGNRRKNETFEKVGRAPFTRSSKVSGNLMLNFLLALPAGGAGRGRFE
eukprot:scaffold102900_cov30-Tisochrysis_lutea.AAC.4